ncbi:hypothetical protein [uncultured Thiocystis sp.]|jgi:hypothetical protein|uniref:hypothetical protein n=1 Tax=uncultured Thiocystis sp. TaxID=1202134 RepID=UPI0025F0B2B1|nr:hypothetical protein [uncultured Thiocystis sp.]
MPSKDRGRVKGRATSGSFTALPHSVFRASGERPAPVANLHPSARAFLVDICQQLNGRNNGNLAASPSVMSAYGWTTGSGINSAVVELVAFGYLVQTRQGGRNRCSLYGVTWRGIDEGPHDAKPDPVPLNLWHADKEEQRDPEFMRRWKSIQQGRRGKNASLYTDKGSLSREKSARNEAA